MKVAVVVATLPLTVEVKVREFVVVDTVRVLEVEEATRLVRSVEVATPLIRVVSTVPEVKASLRLMRLKRVVVATPLTFEVRVIALVEEAVESVLDDITEEVAVTPLIVVVKVFPARV